MLTPPERQKAEVFDAVVSDKRKRFGLIEEEGIRLMGREGLDGVLGAQLGWIGERLGFKVMGEPPRGLFLDCYVSSHRKQGPNDKTCQFGIGANFHVRQSTG